MKNERCRIFRSSSVQLKNSAILLKYIHTLNGKVFDRISRIIILSIHYHVSASRRNKISTTRLFRSILKSIRRFEHKFEKLSVIGIDSRSSEGFEIKLRDSHCNDFGLLRKIFQIFWLITISKYQNFTFGIEWLQLIHVSFLGQCMDFDMSLGNITDNSTVLNHFASSNSQFRKSFATVKFFRVHVRKPSHFAHKINFSTCSIR